MAAHANTPVLNDRRATIIDKLVPQRRWLLQPTSVVDPITGLTVVLDDYGSRVLGSTARAALRRLPALLFDLGMRDRPNELFVACLLDARFRLIGVRHIGEGSSMAVVVDKPDLARAIAFTEPYAVVLAHNHTGPDVEPSAGDDETTEAVRGVCEPLGVVLFDHLILAAVPMKRGGERAVWSYRQEGRGGLTEAEGDRANRE